MAAKQWDPDKLRHLSRNRMYIARLYPKPKPDAVLSAQRNQPDISDRQLEEHWCELSDRELRDKTNARKSKVITEHIANSAKLNWATVNGEPRRNAGEVYDQLIDEKDGSMYVGIRCMDGPEGRWLCGQLEDPDGLHGFSLGHRINPVTGEITVDEVSHCIEGKHPGTGLVDIIDYKYPADLKWEPEIYKAPVSQKPIVRALATMSTPSTGSNSSSSSASAPPQQPPLPGSVPNSGAAPANAQVPVSVPMADDVASNKRKADSTDEQPQRKAQRTENATDVKDGKSSSSSSDDPFVRVGNLLESLSDAGKPVTKETRREIMEFVTNMCDNDTKKTKQLSDIMKRHDDLVEKTKSMKDDEARTMTIFADTIKKVYSLLKKDAPAYAREMTASGSGERKLREFLPAINEIMSQASAAMENYETRLQMAPQRDPELDLINAKYQQRLKERLGREQSLENNMAQQPISSQASAAQPLQTVQQQPAAQTTSSVPAAQSAHDLWASHFSKLDRTSGSTSSSVQGLGGVWKPA